MGGEYSVIKACQNPATGIYGDEFDTGPLKSAPSSGIVNSNGRSPHSGYPQQAIGTPPPGPQPQDEWQPPATADLPNYQSGAPAPLLPQQTNKKQLALQPQNKNRSCISSLQYYLSGSGDSPMDPGTRQAQKTPSGEAATWQTGASALPQEPEPLLKEMRSDGPVGSVFPVHAEVPSTNFGKVRRLSDGVDLYTKQLPEPNLAVEYTVHNRKLAELEITATLAGSQNMAWMESPLAPQVITRVGPEENKFVGTARTQTPGGAASLSMSFNMKFSPMSQKHFEPIKEENKAMLKQLADVMKQKDKIDPSLPIKEDRKTSKGKPMISVSEMNHDAQRIREACKAAGTSFLDLEFYPDDSALYDRNCHPTNPPAVIWKRPKDFLDGTQLQLYSDGISPSDIKQGALGDCWFLASLAALTEFHSTIETILARSEPNDEGVYEIVCWKNGRHTSVIIDDWFPCSPTTGQPVYSHTHGNELWVIIMEKAWAKLHGSYQRIEAGIPFQGLMDLVCEPGMSHPFSHNVQEIQSGQYYEMLKRYDLEGYVMTASTPGKDELTKNLGGNLPSIGIVPGHAYTLKAVKEYRGEQLVQLRNPWGQFEWDGRWSDSSNDWTPDACQALEYMPDKKDGLFWMTAADFFAHFDDVQAAHCRANNGAAWNIQLKQIGLKGKAGWLVAAVQFHVDCDVEGFLTLWQLDERQRGNPEYSKMPFALYGPVQEATPDALPSEVMRSPAWRRREMVREVSLTAGRYFVAVWNMDVDRAAHDTDAIVMFHLAGTAPLPEGAPGGGQNCSIVAQAVDPTDKLANVAAICSAMTGKGSDTKDYGDFTASTCWLPYDGYAVVLSNKTQATLDVTIDFAGSTGLLLVQRDPSRPPQSQVARCTLGPEMQAQLAAELRPDLEVKDASVNYRISYTLN